MSDTDFVKKKMSFNVNSALVALIGLLGGFCTWSINRNIDTIDRRFDLMMPRAEIESRLENIRASNNRLDGDLLDLRARVSSVEVQLFKMKKP